MRLKVLVGVTAAAIIGAFVPSPAWGQATDVTSGSGTVSANLVTAGSRSIGAVAPIVLDGPLTGTTSNYNVVVTEVARTGTNPWEVTAQICAELDCTTPNALKSGADTLATSNIAVSSQAVAELLPGGSGTLAAGTDANLGAPISLFENTGQATNLAYSETYTATGALALSVPNNQPTGNYTGFFVVTLVQ